MFALGLFISLKCCNAQVEVKKYTIKCLGINNNKVHLPSRKLIIS